ncbi:hypothetical protein Dimus_004067, partial [Dionaea muscipula]
MVDLAELSRDEIFSRFIAALEKIQLPRMTPVGDDDNVLLDRAICIFQDALHHVKGRTNEKSKDVTTLDWNESGILQCNLYVDLVPIILALVHLSQLTVQVLITIMEIPVLVVKGEGTLLSTDSYDGQARIWNID